MPRFSSPRLGNARRGRGDDGAASPSDESEDAASLPELEMIAFSSSLCARGLRGCTRARVHLSGFPRFDG